jgi:hypothetical protein
MGEFTVESLTWISELLTWVGSPSIVPWVGVAGAITAAVTVEPKTWLKSPWNSVGRALQVAVVFLIVAWMLNSVARPGSGTGSGKGDGNESEKGKANPNAPVAPPVNVVPGQFPSGTLEHVDVVVAFVPSASNQSFAQDFSCDLHYKDARNKATKFEIRAKDMAEFYTLLEQQLGGLNPADTPKGLTVLIHRSPFPGENVLRRVRDIIQEVLPVSTVEFDE